MPTDGTLLKDLQRLNETAAFNRWAGFEVVDATEGSVSLRMPWRAEFGQYSGNLHAGLVSALIDTACGFAAYTLSGPVAASHCAVSYLAPGTGEAFIATARTVRSGRRQIFMAAELHDEREGVRVLIATGETILVPVR
ncbi:PaaI family thioesterase [Streptomyces sp. NPDC091217]|uniref:PaaI family thioesterase n=1 Tax=Streptomyces sp. NPDC091217 TaxID=3365975 RepID=UPI00381182EB